MRRVSPRVSTALLATGLVLLVVVAVLWVWPSDQYLFLPDVAHPVAPLISVPAGDAAQDKDDGAVYFVDVIVRKASLLERIFPGLHDGADLVPADQVVPAGGNDNARRSLDLQEMSRSQSIASAVALRALGKPVRALSTGSLVDAVDPQAPAAGRVRPGDRIVAVDGEPVRTPADLRRLITAHAAGSSLQLTLASGAGRRTVSVRTHTVEGRPVIGVVVEPAVDVRLPVRVKIDAGQIGGPSAGLPFALDIMEKLGRDVDHGHKVAATGELALNGQVLPVGGLKQKTIGARRAGVDIFLVPAGENAAEARRYAGGLRIVPVKSFRQALSVLQTAF